MSVRSNNSLYAGYEIPELPKDAKLLVPPHPLRQEGNWPLLTPARSERPRMEAAPSGIADTLGGEMDVEEDIGTGWNEEAMDLSAELGVKGEEVGILCLSFMSGIDTMKQLHRALLMSLSRNVQLLTWGIMTRRRCMKMFVKMKRKDGLWRISNCLRRLLAVLLPHARTMWRRASQFPQKVCQWPSFAITEAIAFQRFMKIGSQGSLGRDNGRVRALWHLSTLLPERLRALAGCFNGKLEQRISSH